MSEQQHSLTGVERRLSDDDIIVSKTDLKGRITYCNRIFRTISGFSDKELIGAPHNIIRHPAMPRSVFKALWDSIEAGKEIFAYVVNRAKQGDHYWVLAHVTPDIGMNGEIIGYNSFRRSVRSAAIAVIEPLYRDLLAVEAPHRDPKEAARAGLKRLEAVLAEKGVTYEQFVLGL